MVHEELIVLFNLKNSYTSVLADSEKNLLLRERAQSSIVVKATKKSED